MVHCSFPLWAHAQPTESNTTSPSQIWPLLWKLHLTYLIKSWLKGQSKHFRMSIFTAVLPLGVIFKTEVLHCLCYYNYKKQKKRKISLKRKHNELLSSMQIYIDLNTDFACTCKFTVGLGKCSFWPPCGYQCIQIAVYNLHRVTPIFLYKLTWGIEKNSVVFS